MRPDDVNQQVVDFLGLPIDGLMEVDVHLRSGALPVVKATYCIKPVQIDAGELKTVAKSFRLTPDENTHEP